MPTNRVVNLLTNVKEVVRSVDLSDYCPGGVFPAVVLFEGKYYGYQSDSVYKEMTVANLSAPAPVKK